MKRTIVGCIIAAALLGCSSHGAGGSAGGGSDGGSSSSATSSGVDCSVTSDGCSCYAGGSTQNGFACDTQELPGATCCASAGWPSAGMCECKKPDVWKCAKDTDGSCSCGPDVTSSAIASCAAPSGTTCCESNSGCDCPSTSGSYITCSGKTETQVTSCSTRHTYICPSGTTQVASCASAQSGSSSSSSSSSSGGSTCFPNNDSCSGDGDCKCGASCFATCPSCSKYCGVRCSSLSDCNAAADGYFSECSSTGRCVR